MSTTFSAKAGSLDSLTVPDRHGCRSLSRHGSAMTLCDTLMPSWRRREKAISRLDPWVSPVTAGGVVRPAWGVGNNGSMNTATVFSLLNAAGGRASNRDRAGESASMSKVLIGSGSAATEAGSLK
jgi:hypothetical protein